MSKPRWAPRHAKWGPVKPGFWPIWHANKDSLRDNGYSIRKNDEGQWQVRFVPGTYKGWPPVKKPEPILVPAGMKASICPNCGQTRVIPRAEAHKDCDAPSRPECSGRMPKPTGLPGECDRRRCRDLFEVVPGGSDEKIADTQKVKMRDGLRFFTAPAQINPGSI